VTEEGRVVLLDFGLVTALAGRDRSLRHLIEHARAVRLAETEWRGAGISDRFTRNINTPDDLAEVSQHAPR